MVAPGRLASLGTPLSEAHADLLPRVQAAFCVGEGVEVWSKPDGTLLQAGDPLVHRDQHLAYDLLAEDPTAFYRGDFADALVGAVEHSAALDAHDLRIYRVVESAPRQAAFGGYTVLARGDDLDDLLNTLARAGTLLGRDPRRDPEVARELVDALRGVDRRAETTNVVAADADGNVCTITTSLGLGSGVWVPGFGVHLNSMMGEGELQRGTPIPGPRLGSMMSPLVALDSEHGRCWRRVPPEAAGSARLWSKACCGCSPARLRNRRSSSRG